MKKTFLKINNKGFTLVELLITIVIFVLLTGVVLFNQKQFDSTIFLKNLAYDIALTIRQAQTYGVNVRESQENGNFSSYGIYFDLSITDKNFIFFSDLNKDLIFNGDMDCLGGEIDECTQKYNVKRGNYISSLKACDNFNCYDDDKLMIYFQRPNPEALIYLGDNRTTKYEYAEIEVSSADGSGTKTVVVTNVGQIYVKK